MRGASTAGSSHVVARPRPSVALAPVDRPHCTPVTTEYEQRPWGSYTVLDDSDTHKVKRLEVHPGERLSYQRHRMRAEHWFVVAGEAHVTLDDVGHRLAPGDAIDIPRGAAHRIANPGADVLVFVEVQHGDSFTEDDIERLDDDYGRAPVG